MKLPIRIIFAVLLLAVCVCWFVHMQSTLGQSTILIDMEMDGIITRAQVDAHCGGPKALNELELEIASFPKSNCAISHFDDGYYLTCGGRATVHVLNSELKWINPKVLCKDELNTGLEEEELHAIEESNSSLE